MIPRGHEISRTIRFYCLIPRSAGLQATLISMDNMFGSVSKTENNPQRYCKEKKSDWHLTITVRTDVSNLFKGFSLVIAHTARDWSRWVMLAGLDVVFLLFGCGEKPNRSSQLPQGYVHGRQVGWEERASTWIGIWSSRKYLESTGHTRDVFVLLSFLLDVSWDISLFS